MAKKLGFAGTWGSGANAMNNIHVRDCANGLLLVLKAALKGKAKEGSEGLCTSQSNHRFARYEGTDITCHPDFSASMEPRMTYNAWTTVMGNVSHLHASFEASFFFRARCFLTRI